MAASEKTGLTQARLKSRDFLYISPLLCLNYWENYAYAAAIAAGNKPRCHRKQEGAEEGVVGTTPNEQILVAALSLQGVKDGFAIEDIVTTKRCRSSIIGWKAFIRNHRCLTCTNSALNEEVNFTADFAVVLWCGSSPARC